MSSNDPWTWRAIFSDGTVVEEYDDQAPEGRGWAAVERAERRLRRRGERLACVLLLPTRESLPTHVVARSVLQPPRAPARVRVLRRRSITLNLETGEEEASRLAPVTIVGLRRARAQEVFTFFFADGSVVVSDDFNAV